MPRDFDKELLDDRTFKIGGETFTWRYLHWREYAVWMDDEAGKEEEERRQAELARAERMKASIEAGEEPPEDPLPDPGTLLESYETVVDRICVYLSKEDHERFRTAIDKEGVVVPQIVLRELATWLVEQQNARPTGQATTSTRRGRGQTAATSAAA